MFSHCLEQCSLKNTSPVSNWRFCSEQTVTPSAWVLGELSVLWERLQKGCSGKASVLACLALDIPGFSLSRHMEKLRKQKEAVGCGILQCSFKGFSLLPRGSCAGQRRSTILAKWKCVKDLGPTRPPYLDLLTLWLSKPNLASQNWLMEHHLWVSDTKPFFVAAPISTHGRYSSILFI